MFVTIFIVLMVLVILSSLAILAKGGNIKPAFAFLYVLLLALTMVSGISYALSA